MREITSEVTVYVAHPVIPASIRLVMKHRSRTIGVLKSYGWDLNKDFVIEYNPHPWFKGDDSFLRVYQLGVNE